MQLILKQHDVFAKEKDSLEDRLSRLRGRLVRFNCLRGTSIRVGGLRSDLASLHLLRSAMEAPATAREDVPNGLRLFDIANLTLRAEKEEWLTWQQVDKAKGDPGFKAALDALISLYELEAQRQSVVNQLNAAHAEVLLLQKQLCGGSSSGSSPASDS